jgi:hypothetical protein
MGASMHSRGEVTMRLMSIFSVLGFAEGTRIWLGQSSRRLCRRQSQS